MGLSRPAEGQRFDGGNDHPALNLGEQLMGEALQVGPIVNIIEAYRGRHGQGALLQHVHVQRDGLSVAVADDRAVPAEGQAGNGGVQPPGAAAVDPVVDPAPIAADASLPAGPGLP